MSNPTYAASGVSIEANDEAVELIAKRIAAAGATRPEVIGQIGGFAAAFDGRFASMTEPVLISGTDGVGTKLVIAQTLDRHDTVGIDAVAMVVDDIVCAGAEPLFLLDYIACGRNVPERTADIVEGVARGCAMAGAALIGGEIAEHPGVMDADEYDLATFAVGVVDRAAMIGPERVREGDVILGLGSSGLHSNGYSLIRKLILDKDLDLSTDVAGVGALGEELLRPCRIHAPAVLAGMRAGDVHAAAHVTGGGIAANVARALPENLGARLRAGSWARHAIFDFIQQTGAVADDEMARVFNLGLGMAVFVEPSSADAVASAMSGAGETVTTIGSVVAGHGVAIA